jgi:hypothetical protein
MRRTPPEVQSRHRRREAKDRSRGQTEYGENLANKLAMHSAQRLDQPPRAIVDQANEDAVRDLYLGPDAQLIASNKAA